jgi:hypothetical protein
MTMETSSNKSCDRLDDGFDEVDTDESSDCSDGDSDKVDGDSDEPTLQPVDNADRMWWKRMKPAPVVLAIPTVTTTTLICRNVSTARQILRRRQATPTTLSVIPIKAMTVMELGWIHEDDDDGLSTELEIHWGKAERRNRLGKWPQHKRSFRHERINIITHTYHDQWRVHRMGDNGVALT